MVEQKFGHNHKKYDLQFFQGRMTGDAMKTARHWHNNGIEQLGNDVY
jgi:hypothetical protein